jgi:chromosome segregation ATPase
MDERERIARLEAQHQELMRVLVETRDEIKSMREEMHQVKDSLTKWRGIGAGIAIAVSLIWTAGLAIWSLFAQKG